MSLFSIIMLHPDPAGLSPALSGKPLEADSPALLPTLLGASPLVRAPASLFESRAFPVLPPLPSLWPVCAGCAPLDTSPTAAVFGLHLRSPSLPTEKIPKIELKGKRKLIKKIDPDPNPEPDQELEEHDRERKELPKRSAPEREASGLFHPRRSPIDSRQLLMKIPTVFSELGIKNAQLRLNKSVLAQPILLPYDYDL